MASEVNVMEKYLYDLPQQFAACLQMSFDFTDRCRSEYDNILLCGMGGSAIGGDILRTYGQERAAIPLIVNRGYHVPYFVNDKTLAVMVSFSGNTEETLAAYQECKTKKASVICITSGGKIADLARKNGDGLAVIPGDLVPRAATGYLLGAAALILEELGLLPGVREEISETIRVLTDMRRDLEPQAAKSANPARKIADSLQGNLPLIWGVTGSSSEAAALRWKGQINENAKSPAFYNLFPELNHNEIVGFQMPENLLSRVVIIILRDKSDNVQNQKRMAITKGIVEKQVKEIIEVESIGAGFLARLYSLIYIGDYASYYLALNYGIDPTPVKVIDHLKARLSG